MGRFFLKCSHVFWRFFLWDSIDEKNKRILNTRILQQFEHFFNRKENNKIEQMDGKLYIRNQSIGNVVQVKTFCCY